MTCVLGLFFGDMPTKEEYLAKRAYRNLLKITKSAPSERRAELRGDVAIGLIKDVYAEGNRKQADEMWRVLHKEMPEYVTEERRPAASKI